MRHDLYPGSGADRVAGPGGDAQAATTLWQIMQNSA